MGHDAAVQKLAAVLHGRGFPVNPPLGRSEHLVGLRRCKIRNRRGTVQRFGKRYFVLDIVEFCLRLRQPGFRQSALVD